MVVIELTYTKPLEEVERFLEAHRAFLQTCYDQKLLVASGPQNPRVGGVVIALGNKESALQIMEEDPFYKQGIAVYRFIEFEPVKRCAEIDALL